MKATTLASLLVTSAAAGAAAGGPFWLTYTVPFAYTVSPSEWQSSTPTTPDLVDFPTSSANRVITDIFCGYGSSGPRTFNVVVNGQPAWGFSAYANNGVVWGQAHHLENGIPVPAGATLRVESPGGAQPTFSISGYEF